MRSSTSSFRQELKVLAVMALALVGYELYAGVRDARAQWDYAKIRSFPSDMAALRQEQGLHVVLMGNSLVRTDYDEDLLNEKLAAGSPRPIRVMNGGLFSSTMVEWHYIIKRSFVQSGQKPDVVVLNFAPGCARDQDWRESRVDWLAEEVAWGDVPELLTHDLRSPEAAGAFLHARSSPVYRTRWDRRCDILWHLMPDYQKSLTAANGLLNEARAAAASRSVGTGPAPTYELLNRLMAMGKENGIHIVVVALPIQHPYELDPQLRRTVEAAGMSFLDCRAVPGLKPEHYDDRWHMSTAGAQIFTEYMARRLPEVLANIPGH